MLDAIYFPQAEAVPESAMAFMNMMFAHSEFEEQVREMQAAVVNKPAFVHKRWDARKRLGRMAKLIRSRSDRAGSGSERDRPHLDRRHFALRPAQPSCARSLLALRYKGIDSQGSR
jgi:hypothetical protein